MKNYIGLNIKYLCENNFLSQDEFGARFGLKKSVVGTYVRGISQPKIEVMQKICNDFNLTLDELVNEDLYLKNRGYTSHSEIPQHNTHVSEPAGAEYSTEKEALLKTIEAQQETIAALKITVDTLLHREN